MATRQHAQQRDQRHADRVERREPASGVLLEEGARRPSSARAVETSPAALALGVARLPSVVAFCVSAPIVQPALEDLDAPTRREQQQKRDERDLFFGALP